MAPKKQTKATNQVDDAPEPHSSALRGRVFIPMQSAGRVGKSTLIDIFAGWLDEAGIPWRGADFDSVHQTFSRAYQDNVMLSPLEEKEVIPRTLDALATSEPVAVTICDMPAQATDRLLASFRQYGALELLAGAGLKITVPLFLVDDQGARESLLKVVKEFGNSVSYLLVRNPARGTSSRVEATQLVSGLIDEGAPIITLPELSTVTLDAIGALQRQERKFFPLSGVGPLLPGLAKLEMSKFLPRVWRQMEEAADVLVPDPRMIVNKVQGGHAPQETANHDPFDA